MAKFEYDNLALKWEIQSPDEKHIPIDDATFLRFVNTLKGFNERVPLKSFKSEVVAVNPPVYSYSFEAKDGRAWYQQIKFDGAVTQKFDVPDFWNEESEFSFHREVRRTLIELIQTFGLTKAEFEWS